MFLEARKKLPVKEEAAGDQGGRQCPPRGGVDPKKGAGYRVGSCRIFGQAEALDGTVAWEAPAELPRKGLGRKGAGVSLKLGDQGRSGVVQGAPSFAIPLC